nr:uncharacterized protein LOC121129010 isoform X2 [Lepeophtheirus salmonis]
MENQDNLDIMFELIFTECDKEIRSGQVRANSLFECFQKFLGSLSSYKMDEIHRLLDPHRDNRFLDMDTFKKLGPRITHIITVNQNPGDSLSMSRLDCLQSYSNSTNTSQDESSLGLLNESLMNATIGSLEGFGMDSTGSCNADLRNNLSELKFQNDNLHKEKKDLEKEQGKSHFREVERMNNKLVEENEILKRNLREAKINMESLQQKNQDLALLYNLSPELRIGSGIKSCNEKIEIEKSRYEEVLLENKRLIEELEDAHSSDLKARNDVQRRDKAIQNLTFEIIKVKDELDEKSKSLKHLETNHKLAQNSNESILMINQKLEIEIDRLKGNASCTEELKNSSLSQFMKLKGDDLELSFDSNDILWNDFSNKENMPHNLSQLMENRLSLGSYNITSTPFFVGTSKGGRCSISDEFKKEGVYGLPMIDRNTVEESNEFGEENNEGKASITTDVFTSSPHENKSCETSILDVNENVKSDKEEFVPPRTNSLNIRVKCREDKSTQTSESEKDVTELLDSIIHQVVIVGSNRSYPGSHPEPLSLPPPSSNATEPSYVKELPLRGERILPISTFASFDMTMLRKTIVFILLFCVFCTFFGSIQIGNRTLYPMTWPSSFPEPFIFIRKTPESYPQIW